MTIKADNLLLSTYKRNDDWPKLRRRFKKRHPECAVCGGKSKGNNVVHHIKPYHWYPELEMEESNLITLCKSHHLTFAHLMDYKSWNPSVRDDAAIWLQKIKNRERWRPK
jgi:5-methylcytosine-specific restriction endonuclease McrA